MSEYWNARKADVEERLGKATAASKTQQFGYTVHFAHYKGSKVAKVLPAASGLQFRFWWEDPRVSSIDIMFKPGTKIDTALSQAGLSYAKLLKVDTAKVEDPTEPKWLKEYQSDPKGFQREHPRWQVTNHYKMTGHSLEDAEIFVKSTLALSREAKIVEEATHLSIQCWKPYRTGD